jgi:hypothetical protein
MERGHFVITTHTQSFSNEFFLRRHSIILQMYYALHIFLDMFHECNLQYYFESIRPEAEVVVVFAYHDVKCGKNLPFCRIKKTLYLTQSQFLPFYVNYSHK